MTILATAWKRQSCNILKRCSFRYDGLLVRVKPLPVVRNTITGTCWKRTDLSRVGSVYSNALSRLNTAVLG
jgi:hypothetical protein